MTILAIIVSPWSIYQTYVNHNNYPHSRINHVVYSYGNNAHSYETIFIVQNVFTNDAVIGMVFESEEYSFVNVTNIHLNNVPSSEQAPTLYADFRHTITETPYLGITNFCFYGDESKVIPKATILDENNVLVNDTNTLTIAFNDCEISNNVIINFAILSC